ncbi:MAG: hypothetical protein LIP02_06790 [Bacteroidales bacterium]|nr:hypothetical protein [Bacteroidales bacterium]
MKREKLRVEPQEEQRAGDPARPAANVEIGKKRKYEWSMSADGWDEPAEWGETPTLEVDDEVRDFFSDE